MADFKCFGCSYTRHHTDEIDGNQWPTWVDFLRLSNKGNNTINYGLGGSSNEYICRQIIKNAVAGDIVIVMWSAYDRVHSENFLQQKEYNQGADNNGTKDATNGTTLQQLYERTLEYIWMANTYCKQRDIKIINLSMIILNMGETQQLIKHKHHLVINEQEWPIDMESFCLEIPRLAEIHDNHPSPSQHYEFTKKILCPILKIPSVDIGKQQLYELDQKASKVAEQKS